MANVFQSGFLQTNRNKHFGIDMFWYRTQEKSKMIVQGGLIEKLGKHEHTLPLSVDFTSLQLYVVAHMYVSSL